MKYLLDTHALLWVLFEDNKLSKKAKLAIRNPKSEVYVSVISFWEISLKFSLGKLELQRTNPEHLLKSTINIGIDLVGLSADQAATFYHLPRMEHKDLFDRLIIWQDINQNFVLISKDRILEKYRDFGLKILW